MAGPGARCPIFLLILFQIGRNPLSATFEFDMPKRNRFYGIVLAILCGCFVHGFCCGQNIRRYSVTSGLSENTIKCMIQDQKGYIWFATQDGLNVFNGNIFKFYGCSYRPTQDKDSGTYNILSILQHADGERIWVATQSASVFLFDPRTEKFEEMNLREVASARPNLCYCIAYDRNGDLWIGTDSGIFVFDESEGSFRCYSSQNSTLPTDLISSIFCDSQGTVWVGSEKGLSKFNPATNDFVNIRIASGPTAKNRSDHIIAIAEDSSQNLWVGSWDNGFARVNKNNNSLTYVRGLTDMVHFDILRVRNIVPDTHNTLWVCTNIGLFRYDISDNHLTHVVLSTRQLTDNIYSCLKDREGGLWIGTYFNGVYYISPRARQIECYTLDNVLENLHGSAISSFCEDKDGRVWVASENGGLSLFDPSDKGFVETAYHIADDNLHALCMVDNQLYIGTFAKGLRQIDLTTGRVRTFLQGPNSIGNNNVFSLFKSTEGYLYVGTAQGCSRYDPGTGRFEEIKELSGNFIYDIVEDLRGNIWFACYYDGLYRYDRKSCTWTHYLHDARDEYSLPHNKLIQIYQDDKHRLWICSEGGGICRYDYESDNFRKFDLYNEGEKVYLTIVYGILNDAAGNLWISSNHGIYYCDERGGIIRHFTYEDGLQSNQFNFGAAFRSSTGGLYFGGINGFNVFYPENLRDSNVRPTVTAEVKYKTNRDRMFMSFGEDSTKAVVIPRNVNSFSLHFECLSYVAPGNNEFAYTIDKDDQWIHTREPSVTFMNFPYGEHTVRVRARNGDGLWSEKDALLHINNLPPLLKSLGAKCCYIVLVLALGGLVFVFIERRRNEKAQEKIREIEIRQEQEANAARINFFTCVAHEIKTPVTLIKAPLEVVLKKPHSEEVRHNLDIIDKNTRRLLNLVNQLLDFKKINQAGYEIKMHPTDPVHLIQNVINRFSGAVSEGIEIRTDFPSNPVPCLLDAEAYVKIVSNLLANAIKYTRSRIVVELCLRSGADCLLLHLSVKDDGKGIPESEHQYVFNSFYQIRKGSRPRMGGVGLGLALVKLLTEKHNGHVYIDRNYKEGCSVCVDIPYKESHVSSQAELPVSDVERKEDENPACAYADQRILIVEDVEDMRDFISGIFTENQTIFQAENGKDALSILKKHDVDIIISDISMPVMNGFELLREIRKNDMYCHIPFIMLTVESSLDSKIKGLEYGADAYIEKPFSVDHLQATVHNLISSREMLRKRFLSEPLKQKNEAIVSSRDRDWLDKVTELVQARLHDPDIAIDILAVEMNLSRSSFQRKIKGLTGLTPIEFIRLIRLKKAAEYLAEGNYRVNEVCYLVGFNKPSYFSFQFKKQFGILPKDFVQGRKEHGEEKRIV